MSIENEKAQSAFTLDPKEYLKRKGLKNPPIDSSISGGGDNLPVRPSDMMLEFAKKYSRHKLAVLIEENSKYCNRISQLESELAKSQDKCKAYEGALESVKAYLSTKTVEGFEAYTIVEQVLNPKS